MDGYSHAEQHTTSIDKPVKLSETPMQSLMFLSNKFTSFMKKWLIEQKDLHPVIKMFAMCRHLIRNTHDIVSIFIDHNVVEHILSSAKRGKKTQMGRIDRWAMTIQSIETRVMHINSEENAFASLLTRWGAIMRLTSLINLNHGTQNTLKL